MTFDEFMPYYLPISMIIGFIICSTWIAIAPNDDPMDNFFALTLGTLGSIFLGPALILATIVGIGLLPMYTVKYLKNRNRKMKLTQEERIAQLKAELKEMGIEV